MSLQNLGVVLERGGRRALRAVLALLFFGIGLQKLTPYEAAAIRPYAASSPFLGWCYGLFGVRGASIVFGLVEIAIGVGLAIGLSRPGGWPSRLGALGASLTAFVTASFLLTAPGVVVHSGRIPELSISVGQLFVKDLVLLAAAVMVLGESLKARG